MHTGTGVRCTSNAGLAGKMQCNFKNKQQKEPLVWREGGVTGVGVTDMKLSRKKVRLKSNPSLSGLSSRCIKLEEKTYIEGYLFLGAFVVVFVHQLLSLHDGSELLSTI